jgi:hypothetical protein
VRNDFLALDVYVATTRDLRVVTRGERRIALEDNAILSCFQQFTGDRVESSGTGIDIYDDAYFEGPRLVSLITALERARQHFQQQPPQFSVFMDTQTYPEQKELYSSVSRTQVQEAIATLIGLAQEALHAGTILVFVGD